MLQDREGIDLLYCFGTTSADWNMKWNLEFFSHGVLWRVGFWPPTSSTDQWRMVLTWWNHTLVDNRWVTHSALCITLPWSSRACEIDFYKTIDKTTKKPFGDAWNTWIIILKFKMIVSRSCWSNMCKCVSTVQIKNCSSSCGYDNVLTGIEI